MERLNVAILPAGSFGRALAVPLSENSHKVTLIFRSRESQEKFSHLELPANVNLTYNHKQALEESNIVVLVPPSKHLREVYSTNCRYINSGAWIICGTKGLEQETNLTTFQVLKIVNPSLRRWAIMSGPNFASEIAQGLYTETVIASAEDGVAEKLRRVFITKRFKPYVTDDVMGVALGGTLKNLIAMTRGIVEGKGMGSNFSASLLNSELREANRLAVVMGADERTLYGRSGLADIVLSSRPPGRNYLAGLAIGQGVDPKFLMASGETIEGFDSIRPALSLAKSFGVEVPIFQILYEVLYEELKVDKAVDRLMEINGIFEDPQPVIDRRLRFPIRWMNRWLHFWHKVR